MFWGLIMEPGRCYTQTVKASFHVSMAALDISHSSEAPAQVMCVLDGRNYLLCTLNKKDHVQCPLDLNFEVGTKVSFATNGKAHVHLTGYLVEDIEEELEEEEEEVVSNIGKKRPKREIPDTTPSKKSKINESSLLEEESDDSDFDLNKVLDSEESDDGEAEEEEGEAEEEEDDEDEDDEEDEDSSEVEEVEEPVKPKQNGVAKPGKKNQKQEKTPEKKVKEQKKPEKPKKTPEKANAAQSKKVLKGGLQIHELKEGTGEVAKEGKFVHVYYEGRLRDNNKLFDSTTKGPGFSFRLGKGEVIKGWDLGLVGMKVGGKRRITCPPKMAYGADGSPPVIPPNAVLVFDVELKKVS